MKLHEKLKQLRKQHKYTQADIAARVNLTQPAYGRYEIGDREPGYDTLSKLAAIYGVTVDYLIADTEAAESAPLPKGIIPMKDMPHHYIPVLGSVAAGTPLYMEENYGVYVDSVREADFALTVEGSSMAPTYLAGDVVYIKSVPDAPDGTVCVIAIDDSCTLKHLYHIPGGVQLVSDNPAYAPMIYTADNADVIRVLGVVVGFTRLYRHG